MYDEDRRIYDACLMFHKVGTKTPRFMGCYEMHRREEGGKEWIVTFGCLDDGFYFEPNGQFHFASTHGSVQGEPDGDYKDSLVISVGRCASVSGEPSPDR